MSRADLRLIPKPQLNQGQAALEDIGLAMIELTQYLTGFKGALAIHDDVGSKIFVRCRVVSHHRSLFRKRVPERNARSKTRNCCFDGSHW